YYRELYLRDGSAARFGSNDTNTKTAGNTSDGSLSKNVGGLQKRVLGAVWGRPCTKCQSEQSDQAIRGTSWDGGCATRR
ncbi:hypothetical protein, partial [Yersinia enterocolitica]